MKPNTCAAGAKQVVALALVAKSEPAAQRSFQNAAQMQHIQWEGMLLIPTVI